MNVLDLFSGAVGGWSVGLTRDGYRTVAACEIDEWRRAVFAAGHPACRMYADARELTAEQLRADLGYLPDVVVGSPPCQEISTANCKGTGITDDHLFWEWARIVFKVRPLWCAAENSPNARLSGIDGILDALDQAGYAYWPLVVGADHAGANHRRRRLWLIAADANRAELWQQPGRSGGTNGRCAAVAGEHDPDPDGRLAGGAWRHADGCLAMGAEADGNAADADREGQHGFACNGEMGGRMDRLPPHADREGLAVGPRLARHDGEELPAALGAIGRAWPHWNGGLAGLAAACAAAGFGDMDDGDARGLPANLRNRAIAALGDAVIPQIPEIIGMAMRSVFLCTK